MFVLFPLHRVLIETYWNVNSGSLLSGKPLFKRINRNILECKCIFERERCHYVLRINRNILECKYLYERLRSCPVDVLIETYWNVNEWCLTGFRLLYNVLIETYWNVNGDTFDVETSFVTRINRNILECKCNWRNILERFTHVLIETYWNVNGVVDGNNALPTVY